MSYSRSRSSIMMLWEIQKTGELGPTGMQDPAIQEHSHKSCKRQQSMLVLRMSHQNHHFSLNIFSLISKRIHQHHKNTCRPRFSRRNTKAYQLRNWHDELGDWWSWGSGVRTMRWLCRSLRNRSRGLERKKRRRIEIFEGRYDSVHYHDTRALEASVRTEAQSHILRIPFGGKWVNLNKYHSHVKEGITMIFNIGLLESKGI